MRRRQASCIVTFHTTADAMETERVCRAAGLPGRLIPAPRNLTADCGIAWCGPAETRPALEAALRAAGVEAAGLREQLY